MPPDFSSRPDSSESIANDVLGNGPPIHERGDADGGSKPQRLRSLDALRGFDMFWIIGGGTLVHALNERFDAAWLRWLSEATAGHPAWHGFAFWDLIFPLFLFIAGVSLPFSFSAKRERGLDTRRLSLIALRRGLLLVALGWAYNGGLAFGPLDETRFPSVLGRIGLAWMCAAWIYLITGTRGRLIWTFGLLLGYWLVMRFVSIPGGVAGDFTMEGNVASWVDRNVLPGRLHKGIHDPEGLFTTIPAIATALMGILTGQWLRAQRPHAFVKALGILAVGAAFVYLGRALDGVFPINKNLWTSTFAIYSAGWSLLLLGVFYLLIDVCRMWMLFYPFIVIGLNPITIYLVQHRLIDFEKPVEFLAGGSIQGLSTLDHAIAFAALVLLAKWLFLLFLHRKRVYLRV
ncbi:MAG: putative acyltransferase [Planctomycetota bacterium]|jgi:predicted acyltransferase